MELPKPKKLLAGGLALLLVGTLCRPCAAQVPESKEPFSSSSANWEGYSEFVRLAQRQLGTKRVRLTTQLDYDSLRPGDAVVIVHPLQALDDASLSAFLADGGRVGLLDDYGQGENLLRKFDIRRVPAPPDPERRLRANPDLAIAVPSVQLVAGAERGRHPMTEHVDQVVTNHAVAFKHPDLTSVLEIRDTAGGAGTIAVTGVIANQGRLFALGDPSVFINLMMRYPGNRKLAEGLIHYLVARTQPDGEVHGQDVANQEEIDSEGVRESQIIVVANHFDQIGHYGEEDTFLSELRKKLDELVSATAAIKENGIPPGLSLALAAAIALWLFSSQLKSHLRTPQLVGYGFARPPALAAQTGLGARALVLSSASANPILALLELDGALRETVARRLQLNPSGSANELREKFTHCGLSAEDSHDLADLLSQLRGYGQGLTQGKSKKPTDSELERLHGRAMRLLSELERVGGKS